MVKKAKNKKKRIIIWVILIIGLVITPSFIFYNYVKKYFETSAWDDECKGWETISPYCEDNQVFKKTCVNEIWKKELIKVCNNEEQCAFGECIPTECGKSTQFCINDFELVIPYCENNILQFKKEFCGEKTYYDEVKGYCKDAQCHIQPGDCGDGICQIDEDEISCYRDCSSINSSDLFAREVNTYIDELYPYLQCDDDFNCNNPKVINLANSILNDYNIPDGNPQKYMDAVVDYVYNEILYNFGGGKHQCGESASDMIERKWGNCVDYSVLAISLLRVKGIPARQATGCVSHEGWICHTFATRTISKLGGVQIRWDSKEQEELTNEQVVGGDVLGHSWIEVWIPDKGWITADPTVGDTISKKCLGYYAVKYGGTGEKNADCDKGTTTGYWWREDCYTSALCHIEGREALEFCKTY